MKLVVKLTIIYLEKVMGNHVVEGQDVESWALKVHD